MQLVKRHRDTRGFSGDHALVKIVRLTIETNLLTSKHISLASVRQLFLRTPQRRWELHRLYWLSYIP